MSAGRHGGGVIINDGSRLKFALSKVPEVTAWFWIVKVLSTAMGESISDYLVHRLDPYLAVLAGFVAFAVAIIAQFSVHRYITWLYWTTVAMVAIFGTMVADAMHVGLHIPYKVSASVFLVAVVVILGAWYATEHTLSIHSITTPRREFFYWATVVSTFALGTATGDLSATTFHLGYLASAALFTGLIVIPAVAYRMGLNGVAAFWIAYILTRPIGASFADYLGFPKDAGGVGVGHGPVALTTSLIFILLVVYLAVSRKDAPASTAPYASPAPPASAAPRAG